MKQYDVVVVGKGNAALCAALSARDKGARVAMLEAANVDEFLTSRRDGKKFVIIYRGMEGSVGRGIWAYEAEGVDGRRVVLDSLATTELVPDEEFRKLVPSG